MKWRRVLMWVLIIFALYAVWRAPEAAAGFVNDVGQALGTIVDSIASFFDGLLSRS